MTGHCDFIADKAVKNISFLHPRCKRGREELTEEIIKLHSTHIGHELENGDQIILGESVVLEFSSRQSEVVKSESPNDRR